MMVYGNLQMNVDDLQNYTLIYLELFKQRIIVI